jgi:hypothetical protein
MRVKKRVRAARAMATVTWVAGDEEATVMETATRASDCTQSGETTVAEVMYVLQTGLHLQPISATNKLPMACQRREATQKKAVKVTPLDHEAITEEASKRDRLEYDDDDDDESEEESEREEEIEEESESGDESEE